MKRNQLKRFVLTKNAEVTKELEDYYHYEEYTKRFKLLFEFYQLEELLK